MSEEISRSILCDPEDEERLALFRWRIKDGRPYSIEKREVIFPQWVILGKPYGRVIDHKDGDPFNNKKENLRYCTDAENSRNRRMHCTNTTGFKGVVAHQGKFKAQIGVNCRAIYLGVYTTAEEAARAYDAAALKYFGDFARLNFSKESNHGI